MRSIAVANQKGGVGKTTTSVNLAVALARAGQRVCLVDLDPQAHATLHAGVQPGGHPISAYDVLVGGASLAEARVDAGRGLSVIPSHIDLSAVEMALAGKPEIRESLASIFESTTEPSATMLRSPMDVPGANRTADPR